MAQIIQEASEEVRHGLMYGTVGPCFWYYAQRFLVKLLTRYSFIVVFKLLCSIYYSCSYARIWGINLWRIGMVSECTLQIVWEVNVLSFSFPSLLVLLIFCTSLMG